jgi:hypothetical protein
VQTLGDMTGWAGRELGFTLNNNFNGKFMIYYFISCIFDFVQI